MSEQTSAQTPKQDNILLEVKNLKKYFPIRKGFFKSLAGYVKAVDGVNFFIREGETMGLVGESGCGKTTTGRVILRAYEPTAGEVWFKDRNLGRVNVPGLRIDPATTEATFLRREPTSPEPSGWSRLANRITKVSVAGSIHREVPVKPVCPTPPAGNKSPLGVLNRVRMSKPRPRQLSIPGGELFSVILSMARGESTRFPP